MTNEFNFDVKHEDYKEWLNQIEQVSDADCSLLSEPDPYTKCVRSPEIQKSAAAKMDANGNIHAGNISAQNQGRPEDGAPPSPSPECTQILPDHFNLPLDVPLASQGGLPHGPRGSAKAAVHCAETGQLQETSIPRSAAYFRHRFPGARHGCEDPFDHHRPCVQQHHAEYLCPCDR